MMAFLLRAALTGFRAVGGHLDRSGIGIATVRWRHHWASRGT